MARSLDECRIELSSIINEMRSIESGVRSDFSGIGEDLCANCIGKVADKYENVLRRLRNVDENKITEVSSGN